MALLTDEIRAYIGVSTETEIAADPVEQGEVRRFIQAIMDDDPDYFPDAPRNNRHGGPVAPPLFPNHAIRRGYGAPDVLTLRAMDPDFDGAGIPSALPQIEPLRGVPVLNGGAEFELIRFARHGERVKVTQRYADIVEKESSKGSMLLVTVEAEFRTTDGELLLRARRTSLRRPA